MPDGNGKLNQLLAALDDSLKDLEYHAARARRGIGFRSLAPYYEYRAKLDEYHSLVTVIENAMAKLISKEQGRVKERLLRSERDTLALIIRAALDFFFALSAIPILPLGIRECFAQELHSLHRAQQRLVAPEHTGKLSQGLEGDLETAELILAEILEKAPSLISFDIEKP